MYADNLWWARWYASHARDCAVAVSRSYGAAATLAADAAEDAAYAAMHAVIEQRYRRMVQP